MASALRPIRLVTFDVLHTIITPRFPIHVQYSRVFEPYLGILNPDIIKQSFRSAFRTLEIEQPVYSKGSQIWWREVIRRTALGAGADEKVLSTALPDIVPRLMNIFSSKEGYRAFDDALPTIYSLQRELNIKTAAISNADSRIRMDLGFPSSLNPIILSEEEGIEKPSPEIFVRAISEVNLTIRDELPPIRLEECLHIGDEMKSDYDGALAAGMKALLLRRTRLDGEQAHQNPPEIIDRIQMIKDLNEVIHWVKAYNSRAVF